METDSEKPPNSKNDGDRLKGKVSKEKKSLKKKSLKPDYKWIVTVAVSSFVITIILSLLSNEVLNNLNIVIALIVLVIFIFIGVAFDIVGLSFAICDEKSFHAMSARKIESAKYAIKLIRNAEKVSSFCNDVIGDIAGIISGATASAIAYKLFTENKSNMVANLILTAFVAAFTVGLKALGKSVSANYNIKIVNFISKIIYFFEKKRKKKSKN